MAHFRTCVLLQWLNFLFHLALSAGAGESGHCSSAEGSCAQTWSEVPLCCATPESMQVIRIGNDSTPILVVDNFFCPEALHTLQVEGQPALLKSRQERDGGFPGLRLELDSKRRSPGSAMARLVEGDHLRCLSRLLSTINVSTFPLTAGQVQDVLRTQQRKHAALSAVNKKPHGLLIHIDEEGDFVLNIHLGTRFNDTGTSFWKLLANPRKRVKSDIEFCSKDVQKICIDRTDHANEMADRLRRKGRRIGLPFETDFTGTFEKYFHVHGLTNRLILYSTRLPHTGYFPPDAEALVLKRPQTHMRLMLQHFLKTRRKPGKAAKVST